MRSLMDFLEDDRGLQTKTAGVEASSDDVDALAEALGLDFGKTAADEGDDEDEGKEEGKAEKKDEAEKSASFSGMSSLYNDLFPQDASLGGVVKTAEEEKAAYQSAVGARAYDFFAERFDARVEKLATELASASTASNHSGEVHGDSTPPQAQEDNKPADAHKGMNTKPKVTNELPANNRAETVGHEEQKTAALRKAFLLASLED